MKRPLKKFAFAAAICSVLSAAPLSAHAEMARYNVDPSHTVIGFEVAHMVITKVTGRFADYQASVVMDPEKQEFKSMEASIKTASIQTNELKRDDHLKSPDFFDSEKFPAITFKMKSYKKQGDQYVAVGDLTIRDVTKEVTLTGSFNGTVKDFRGDTRAGFSAEGTIDRKDFGLTWNKIVDNNVLVVGDKVKLKLEVECIKEKPKA